VLYIDVLMAVDPTVATQQLVHWPGGTNLKGLPHSPIIFNSDKSPRALWLGGMISSRFYKSRSATAQLSYVLRYPPITATPDPMTKFHG